MAENEINCQWGGVTVSENHASPHGCSLSEFLLFLVSNENKVPDPPQTRMNAHSPQFCSQPSNLLRDVFVAKIQQK